MSLVVALPVLEKSFLIEGLLELVWNVVGLRADLEVVKNLVDVREVQVLSVAVGKVV